MKIYLDNCCFNRPFDDQSQIRIKLDSEAKLKIQDDILEGSIKFVWSYILEAENTVNPFEERQGAIREWKQYAVMNIKETAAILDRAKDLHQKGLRSKDALHIACAISSGCKYFLTTDDKILNKKEIIDELTITDPIGFIKEVYS
jgi:predicted nucleic acid-binding protein